MTPNASTDDLNTNTNPKTPNSPPERGSVTLQLSLNILESLAQAGWTLVPAMPSAEMIEAGTKAGDVSSEQAAAIYEAMIKTAS